jgi:hypothetical protein
MRERIANEICAEGGARFRAKQFTPKITLARRISTPLMSVHDFYRLDGGEYTESLIHACSQQLHV